jgi:hypothetical protein
LDSIGKRIGVKGDDLSPWYNADTKLLKKFKVSRLLTLHAGSMYGLLEKVYPDFEWVPWRFKRLPSKLMQDPKMIEEALRFIELKCEIQKPKDWYSVSEKQIQTLGVKSFLDHFGGLYHVLMQYRPAVTWDESLFIGVAHFGGKVLGVTVRKLFPTVDIEEDYKFEEGQTVSYFIPSLKLAFDYQGVGEYVERSSAPTARFVLMENPMKVTVAERHGVTLIFVPYWWDRTLASLAATILERNEEFKAKMDLSANEDLSQSSSIPNEMTVQLSSWTSR